MFEWDARKAAANARKHGVSFGEAASIFADPEGLDGPDVAHSDEEVRFLRLGRSSRTRVLMVAYTIRRTPNGEAIRLITARRATPKEARAYAGHSKS